MKKRNREALLDLSKLSMQKTTENLSEIAHCDRFICKNCGIRLEDWVKVVTDEYDQCEYGVIYDEEHYEYTFKFCPECGAKVEDGGADDENS